jgi:hypothetical protein
MKVLICGSRTWTKEDIIRKYLHLLSPTLIIHGDYSGADKIADKVAKEMCIPVHPYPANWIKYGLSAGPIRNQEMLDKENPDLVLAFHPDIKYNSKGTLDMINRARNQGIKYFVITGVDD